MSSSHKHPLQMEAPFWGACGGFAELPFFGGGGIPSTPFQAHYTIYTLLKTIPQIPFSQDNEGNTVCGPSVMVLTHPMHVLATQGKGLQRRDLV